LSRLLWPWLNLVFLFKALLLHIFPVMTILQRNVLQRKVPKRKILLGHILLGQVVPGRVVPGWVVPGQALLGQLVPGRVVPGQALLGQVVPGRERPTLRGLKLMLQLYCDVVENLLRKGLQLLQLLLRSHSLHLLQLLLRSQGLHLLQLLLRCEGLHLLQPFSRGLHLLHQNLLNHLRLGRQRVSASSVTLSAGEDKMSHALRSLANVTAGRNLNNRSCLLSEA
jgi:hypothetical protein